jgi:hypothetical protein
LSDVSILFNAINTPTHTYFETTKTNQAKQKNSPLIEARFSPKKQGNTYWEWRARNGKAPSTAIVLSFSHCGAVRDKPIKFGD